MSPSSTRSNLADPNSSQYEILLQNETIEDRLEDSFPHSIESTSSQLLHEDTRSTMSLYDRSAGRDVHVFDASDRSTLIGGLILTAGITNANLYNMIEIIVLFDSEYVLRNESSITIEKDNSKLLPGNYYIESSHPIHINNEAPLTRTISRQTGTRIQAFCNAVRSRDRQCVITREVAINADRGRWGGFEAAHIFPLAFESLWNDYNYSRWITNSLNEEVKEGKINSVQNGLLLRTDIHQLFDTYTISINPDDNYKIVCFDCDGKGIAGTYFDQRPLDDPQRPSEQLLRWHFRQAVLVNIRGRGEPVFEHDFPPSSDIIGSILEGPKAAERMEFELFSRMAAEFDLTQ